MDTFTPRILSGMLLLLLLSPAVMAGDEMYRANPQRTGTYNDGQSPPENVLKWTFDKKNHPVTAPVVSEGMVFFGSEDARLYALYATNGTEKWNFTTGGMIRSSPAVSNGAVYFGSIDGSIYAVHAGNGTLKWSHMTGDGIGYSSPAIADGVVYILSYDRNLYALDADTGSERWKYPFVSFWGSECESSPAISGGVVYFGDINRNVTAVYAVNGTEKWRHAGPDGMTMIPLSTPVVDNGVIYIGGPEYHTMTALYASNGTEIYRIERGWTNWQLTSPAVENGTLYTGGADPYIYSFDATTRETDWTFDTGQFLRASPSLSDGILYATTPTHLYAVYAGNGTLKWRFDTGPSGWLWGSPVIANGTVYVDGDRLYAIGASEDPPSYFSGHVYSGEVGNTSRGLGNLPVFLYASASAIEPGTFISDTRTDSYGYYQILVPPVSAAYFSIIAIDTIEGSNPAGAMSSGGTVMNASWIRYSTPLAGKPLEGNNFWDYVPTVHGDFSGQPLSGPAPLTVRFTDNSTGYPVTWNWIPEFNATTGNGLITCLSRNCTHTYSFPGLYSVQMRIFNPVSADYVTKTGYINVTNPPEPGTIGLFRNGLWILDYGMDGFVDRQDHYGQAGDVPLAGDINNDGIPDRAVFRGTSGENWIIDYGMNGTVDVRNRFGQNGDRPVIGRMNNDAVMDRAVFRGTTWENWIIDYNMDGSVDTRNHYGQNGDIPLIGDFNNDGTPDRAVFRGTIWMNWIIDYGMNGNVDVRNHYGQAGDIPVIGDFNNDGITDRAVFRAGEWIIDYTMDGSTDARPRFGQTGDIPLVWNQ